MSGLLFSLFINDIAEIFPGFNFWLFADDLKVALRVGGQREVDSMQSMLSRLYHWCSINKMELNIGKCMVMTYHRNKSPILASYDINGQALARCEQVRDLGVTFQKTLEFNSHLNNIKSKALKMLGFLYRNSREFSSVTTLKALYYAYVRSVLEYCSVEIGKQAEHNIIVLVEFAIALVTILDQINRESFQRFRLRMGMNTNIDIGMT
ncbi:uncharacterized protein LOC103505893 [Diaphorina citri]|uniref:Uncharacterized protein LOC103505893 n=1 Tax=Diaphorina citri TaxID=121845 RepID=A0A1S3CVD3_DIACI|nr:uncharacterized protein LOC103505893 [Diaphorina citri]